MGDSLDSKSLNTEKKVRRIIWKNSSKELSCKQVSNEDESSLRMARDDAARKRRRCNVPKSSGDFQVPENVDASMNFQNHGQKQSLCHPQDMSIAPRNNGSSGPCVLPLLPVPNPQDSSSSSLPVVLKGTANRGVTGPPVGVVDIGISKSAYYFRVALPGVKKDPGGFSCEVERTGRVHVRGVTTTGAIAVSRYSRVYTMKFQQQCSPGPFTLSFSLPGAVDPRLFSPNFRSDGIFEGVILKNE